MFSTKPYDRRALDEANVRHRHELVYFESRLSLQTAALARGFEAVCPFVNDQLSAKVVERLAENGTRLLTLCLAGFNHVDLKAAAERDITVTRVPAYSPHAVAEHAIGLVLTMNRRFHRAYARVREGNFSLDGLLGFVLHGKTVGVVGTGRIGTAFCRILAHDLFPSDEVRALRARYVELWPAADIVSLHLHLTPETHHLVDDAAIARMREGVMLINTSRGGLVDIRAVIRCLKNGRIGALGLDVYEEEADLFFGDLSAKVIQDDVIARLLTFPNVLITGHQGFFTREALENIAEASLANATAFETGEGELRAVTLEEVCG